MTLPMNSANQKNFLAPILDKLEETNFVTWHQQALFTIKGQNLKDHIIEGKVPAKFESEETTTTGKISSIYSEWMQQDYNMCFWFLASVDSSFKNRIIHCKSALEIWQKLQDYSAESTKTKIKQLKITKKKNLTISEYLSKIKKIADSLIAIDFQLSHEDYIEIICEGCQKSFLAASAYPN
ncbi:uncharacterized protein [Arachis hypogaea]|uniref:uncharacterized protein n=1 Tax=Arachis hypogaea TaxID=3818 RepID=UPI003B217925